MKRKIIISTLVLTAISIAYFVIEMNVFANGVVNDIDENQQGSQQETKYVNSNLIPATAFWIEYENQGNWFNVDWMGSHKNNASISVYSKTGGLIVKNHFIKICPMDDLKFIEDLENEIEYFDGTNIQLKGLCYLKAKTN